MQYGYAPYGFFKKIDIPGPKPMPFIGTFLEYRKGIHNFDTECHQKYGKVWGLYDGRQPLLATVDTAMIKTILVKECYSIFTNRRMYSIMLHHSSNLLKTLRKNVEADEVIDVKEVFGPYSMDVVTSTAFSVDIDSINHPSDPFVANIKRMVKFNILNPLLVQPSGLHAVDDGLSDVEENTSSGKGLTDNEILSQALIFIFAGYETSSTTMGFLAYNLATHPQIQKTLQEEIDETFPEKGQPTYEALMQMEYLDMVLNESMRLYPIANRLERVSKSSVDIDGVTIPKGTVVIIPIYTLHRDPVLWPEPESFKPERFSKENKDSIDPYSYLPFGAGPRNCIGMRFALVMMKLALVEILQNFSFVTCKETQIPMELSNYGFTTPKDPIKLKLEPRTATADPPSS
ncbi:cytochrome P450 3A19-like [Anarrhichthys ocellatus]|uniref:cytochrome P450 3A19-like n=1 Tax=Anarrhichthys ocellatus TaxID=433405 RepID=UPI0012EEC5F1|nr:cytochrome P450 3A19-like [Anarrhichthys ocellatus]